MACGVPPGSFPQLTFFYSLEKGSTTVLQSVNGITQSLTQRPAFADPGLKKQIGEYYVNKLYSDTFSQHSSTITLPEGTITYNGFNSLNNQGVLPPNTEVVFPIVWGTSNFLCSPGFAYVESDDSGQRKVLIYFS